MELLDKESQLEQYYRFRKLLVLMSSYNLDVCNDNLNKLNKVVKDDEKKIFVEGIKARDCLILSNKGLVIEMARKFQSNIVPKEELEQCGYLGLVTSLYKFKPEKGAKFSSCAYLWIKAAILSCLNKKDLIYIPPPAKRKLSNSAPLYTYVPLEESERFQEETSASSVNQILTELSREEQEIIENEYLEEGELMLALHLGCTPDEANRKNQEVIGKIRRKTITLS